MGEVRPTFCGVDKREMQSRDAHVRLLVTTTRGGGGVEQRRRKSFISIKNARGDCKCSTSGARDKRVWRDRAEEEEEEEEEEAEAEAEAEQGV